MHTSRTGGYFNKGVKIPTQCNIPHLGVRVYPFTRVIILGQNKRKEKDFFLKKKVAGDLPKEMVAL
jgi:hypothetical protein